MSQQQTTPPWLAQSQQAQQGLTANLPPAMLPLTMDERGTLIDMIIEDLATLPFTEDARFKLLMGLLMKLRGSQ